MTDLPEYPEPNVQLRLMCTTDLHGQISGYDYYADRAPEGTGFGLAQAAKAVTALRETAVNSVLFDCGDLLQGTPFTDHLAHCGAADNTAANPIISAMNGMGYDAITAGNHDFNYGLDYLTTTHSQADFPTVLANVALRQGDDPTDDETLFAPFVVLKRSLCDQDGQMQILRIGVIGLTPPQIMVWDRDNLAGKLAVRDAVEATQAFVPAIRSAGADIVIALCHGGIAALSDAPGQENAATAVAAVDGIDAVFTGHLHRLFPGPGFEPLAGVDAAAATLAGKPAVMAGYQGRHIGVIDLTLTRDNGKWRIAAHQSHNHPVADDPAKPPSDESTKAADRVLAAAQPAHEDTLTSIRRTIGAVAQPIYGYFSIIGHDPGLCLVADIQARRAATLLRGTSLADLPLLSAVAQYRNGDQGGPRNFTDIPAGNVALRHVADLYLYPDRLRALRISGAELRGWLERSASIFNTLIPSRRDQDLTDGTFPQYLFDWVFGLEYKIDPTQPARFDGAGNIRDPDAARIVDLRHAGHPVADRDQFIIATNNYRASGAGAFPGTPAENLLPGTSETHQDIIAQHFRDQSTVAPTSPAPWSFVHIPDTGARFVTGQAACSHLDQVTGCNLKKIDGAGPGWQGFELDFG